MAVANGFGPPLLRSLPQGGPNPTRIHCMDAQPHPKNVATAWYNGNPPETQQVDAELTQHLDGLTIIYIELLVVCYARLVFFIRTRGGQSLFVSRRQDT